jgi:hypothetical protein
VQSAALTAAEGPPQRWFSPLRVMVRAVGIEPTLLSEPDFESGASTSSTTPARWPAFHRVDERLLANRKAAVETCDTAIDAQPIPAVGKSGSNSLAHFFQDQIPLVTADA